MPAQIYSDGNQHFACSQYGPKWPGHDGDRITILLALLKELPVGTINLNGFDEHLEFTPSVALQEIIKAGTNWDVKGDASFYLHAHQSDYIVALTDSEDEPNWPPFDSLEYDFQVQRQLQHQWTVEVEGVSQGAYVSQAQHMLSIPSRLGLKAQIDEGQAVWPPRQLNATGQRIDSASKQMTESATILTWTRLSAAGAPSEFSGRAPILDGVSTVLVQFEEGPKGVFMLADDELGSPQIGGKVYFEIRRLYGQDGMMHYGLKAVLSNS